MSPVTNISAFSLRSALATVPRTLMVRVCGSTTSATCVMRPATRSSPRAAVERLTWTPGRTAPRSLSDTSSTNHSCDGSEITNRPVGGAPPGLTLTARAHGGRQHLARERRIHAGRVILVPDQPAVEAQHRVALRLGPRRMDETKLRARRLEDDRVLVDARRRHRQLLGGLI